MTFEQWWAKWTERQKTWLKVYANGGKCKRMRLAGDSRRYQGQMSGQGHPEPSDASNPPQNADKSRLNSPSEQRIRFTGSYPVEPIKEDFFGEIKLGTIANRTGQSQVEESIISAFGEGNYVIQRDSRGAKRRGTIPTTPPELVGKSPDSCGSPTLSKLSSLPQIQVYITRWSDSHLRYWFPKRKEGE